jgi:curli biogenesis system outer membrane secretion channel CsgG
MKTLVAAIALATLAACGVETATTAATVAEAKRREMEQAKKSLDMVKQKVEAASQQMQKSAERMTGIFPDCSTTKSKENIAA